MMIYHTVVRVRKRRAEITTLSRAPNCSQLLAQSMAEGLYASFSEVLSVCQAFEDDLATLLDPESGFVPRIRGLCERSELNAGDRKGLTRIRL